MNIPLRIGILGAGWHSSTAHLPALAHFKALHYGEITLAALCDFDSAKAGDATRKFGFEQSYGSLASMLAEAHLDAVIAVTPIAETSRAIRSILEAKLPVLMEKPLAATLSDARTLVAEISANKAPVMVSMNRRFCPVMSEARRWLGDRKVDYLHARMARHSRTEPDFLESTGIHLIDSLRAINGEVADCRAEAQVIAGATAWILRIVFESGLKADVEVLPMAGHSQERTEFFGAGYHLAAHTAGTDDGKLAAWEDGKLVFEAQPTNGAPGFVADGTYAETCAFIESVAEGKPMHPSPSEVLPSVELCYRIANGGYSEGGAEKSS